MKTPASPSSTPPLDRLAVCRRWFALLAWAFLVGGHLAASARAADSLDFRFERMWPQTENAWYFSRPQGIAVSDSGLVYVVDSGNDRIQVFDAEGRFVRTWGSRGSGEGEFTNPSGIALDNSGQVYVVDRSNDRVQVFDAAGRFLRAWGESGTGNGQFSRPSGIALDPAGEIFVTDSHRVQVFDATGRFLRAWGREGTEPGEFIGPVGIVVDGGGQVFVADSGNDRIQVFDREGRFLRTWGGEGSGEGQFDQPRFLALDDAGRVHVADKYNGRISVFQGDGRLVHQWGIASREVSSNHYFMGTPEAVFVSANGRVYVTDSTNQSIHVYNSEGALVYNPEGSLIMAWTSTGNGAGEFARPSGIAIGPDGHVYVMDKYNNRMQIFTDGGEFLGQWSIDWESGIFVSAAGRVYLSGDDKINVYTLSGELLSKWSGYGSGDSVFERANYTDIAINSAGHIYVIDNTGSRIQVLDAEGRLLSSWGTDAGKYWYPAGIAIDSADKVYVADSTHRQIQVFDSEGGLLYAWECKESSEGESFYPQGIRLDGSGRAYVFDAEHDRIRIFTLEGNYLGSVGSSGSNAGEFSWPEDIAIHADGRLYVADRDNNRVQVFVPSLKSTGPKSPRALLVGGRTAASDALDSGILSVSLMQAYSALKAQGYRDDSGHEEIRVLWNGDAIGLPSGNVLPTRPVHAGDFAPGTDLTRWAQGGERLLLYLVGHGEPGYFYLDADTREILTAEVLGSWLDRVQPSLSDDLTLIYEACHSGSFIEVLKGRNRVLMTSSAADERSLFLNNGLNSYSYSLWSELYMGHGLKGAQQKASLDLQVRLGSPQTPQLDADGNGIPNQKSDLEAADCRCIGITVVDGRQRRGCLVAAAPAPRILAVAPGRTLGGEARADLWLELNPIEGSGVTGAWVVVTRPDFQSDPYQAFDRLPVVELSPDHLLGKQRWVGRYARGERNGAGEIQRGPDVVGDYSLAYYVKNGDGLLSSPLLGHLTQTGGQPAGETSPALYDPTRGRLEFPVIEVAAAPYSVLLLRTGNGLYQLDSVVPLGSTVRNPPLWDPVPGSVTLRSLIVAGDERLHTGLVRLEDAGRWLFSLSVDPASR